MAQGMERVDVCIVGAGISGLSAARELCGQGKKVAVLEKSRGVSGRSATRRWQQTIVDHGAQFFTVRSREFNEFVEACLEQEVCFRWSKGFHKYDGSELIAPDSSTSYPRYACANGMSSIGKVLAGDLDIRRETKVETISIDNGLWTIEPLSGTTVQSDILVLSSPAPQSLDLLAGCKVEIEQSFITGLQSVRYAPSICVVGAYPKQLPEWKGIQLTEDKILAWIGNDTSKRHSPPSGIASVLVFHASAEFSAKWIDSDLDEAADRMLAQAGRILGKWVQSPKERFIQRWRFALVEEGYTEARFLKSSRTPRIYAIGDAFNGAKLEGAYLSGLAAANDMLR